MIALAFVGCSDPTAPVVNAPDDDQPSDATPDDQPNDLTPDEVPAAVTDFVALMNDHRHDEGLSPLVWSNDLANVALAHSQDMRARDFFDHTNPDGDSPFDRMTAAGISYRRAGENIAYGYRTGASVFTGWINSDGHRGNIENAAYTHHGVGYVEDGHYWTHVFATDPSVE